MVIKHLSWKKPYAGKLISYIRKGALSEEEGGFTFMHNASGAPTLKNISKDFDELVAKSYTNKLIKVRLQHIIMSFDEGDMEKLNSEVIQDLITKFITESGYDKTVVFAQLHQSDSGGVHAHIALPNVGILSNKSLRISTREFDRIHREVERYQLEKYGLDNSIVYLDKPLEPSLDFEKQDKNKRKQNEYELKQRSGKITHKNELLQIVNQLIAKSDSSDEFIDQLLQRDDLTFNQRGNTRSLTYKTKNYRFKTLKIEEQLRSLDLDESKQIQRIRKQKLDEIRAKKNKRNLGRKI